VLGEFQRWPEPRTHDIASAIRHAGVPCKVTENLARAHWEKLVWNVPFNGLGVASAAGIDAVSGVRSQVSGKYECLTTAQLLADSRWESLVRDLMLEVISVARKLGHNISDSLADTQIERTRSMGAYKASTAVDFERGLPLELESLFVEPLRQAQRQGVSAPKLEALCSVLSRLDPGNRVSQNDKA
jgi:2-dehydropantoate 2-reductase